MKRCTIFVLILVAGLIASPPVYHYSMGNLSAAPLLPPKGKTDAVMVFTGSSNRLAEGYKYLLDGFAKKIMITGTDYPRDVKSPEVRKLSRKIRKDRIYVDLKAKNTIENARNGAEWALKNKVESILLITAEGHMSRAYFELRRLLPPSVKIYTEAVPGTMDYPGADSETGRLLCRVYEATADASFCYETRDLIRSVEKHLLPREKNAAKKKQDTSPASLADITA